MDNTLKKLLKAVPDSYSDFVTGMAAFLEGEEELTEKMTEYMQKHPDASTSDIIKYHTSIDNTPAPEIVDDDELDEDEK